MWVNGSDVVCSSSTVSASFPLPHNAPAHCPHHPISSSTVDYYDCCATLGYEHQDFHILGLRQSASHQHNRQFTNIGLRLHLKEPDMGQQPRRRGELGDRSFVLRHRPDLFCSATPRLLTVDAVRVLEPRLL